MSRMKRVVIKNSEWARGEGSGHLLNIDDMRCCLGFDTRAHGVPDSKCLEKGLPSEVGVQDWASKLAVNGITYSYESNLEGQVAEVNDDPIITDPERIAILRVLFREAGRIFVYREDL